MSTVLSGKTLVAVPNTKLKVDATTDGDGTVICKLVCNGQRAKVIFTGDEILFDVSEPAQADAEENP